MSTSQASSRIHPVVYRQAALDRRRRWLRDIVLRQIAFRLLVKTDISGMEHIPDSGPTIVVMNHIGAIDPFVVAGVITNRFLVPMSKAENLTHPIVGLIGRAWGVYPVRRGEADRQAIASTLELLRQGRLVLIAPEGTRSPALQAAKDGTTYLATKGGATILPIGLEGTDQFPGALKRLRRAPVTVCIGPAFRFRAEGGRIPRADLRQMTREMMWQIALLLPEARRGVYSDTDQMTTSLLDFVDS